MSNNRFTTEEQNKVIEVVNMIVDGSMSLRKAREYLSATTGKSISHEGVRQIVLRHLEKFKDGRDSE